MSTNAEQYHFSDFTFQNYAHLISLAKKDHPFCDFVNFDPAKNPVLWRHDIDFHPTNALQFAKIEAEQGVIATYFVLLHSSFYNLLDIAVTNQLKEILSYGHKIALHFDLTYYDIKSKDELEYYLKLEKQLLEEVLSCEIDVFSFHITNALTDSFRDKEYAGLVNVYSDYFRSEFDYCSDSNGFWRFERLEDFLKQRPDKPIHALTHPVWWTHKVMSVVERLDQCASEQGKINSQYYRDLITQYDREFPDW